jgi:hypothetical protein
MGGTSKLALAIALVLATAICVTGCGGGSTTSNSSGGTPPTERGSTGADKAEPSKEFIVPGGDNSVQRFGREASASEREAASKALEAYMTARAAADWAYQCIYLSMSAVEPLEKGEFQGARRGCTATLEAIGGNAPASTLVNTMTGPVGSLRVGEGRALALYHGRGGVDYVMPMTMEDGQWKVAALAPLELP